MWTQGQPSNATANVTISGTGATQTPKKPVRERLAEVREALLKCHAVTEHIHQALDPTPQKDSGGPPSGPMGLESISNDLEVLSNSLADRLQYIAARLGG